jgi:hypothetical protein
MITQVVKVLVKSGGYEVDGRTDAGVTPMMLAAQRGHVDVVRYLVDSGGSYMAQNTAGSAPLHEAVINGHVHTVRYLCSLQDAKYTFTMVGEAGTPIMLAVFFSREDVLSVLLKAGCRVAEGPPPAQIVRMFDGKALDVVRQNLLDVFYVMLLTFLPSIQVQCAHGHKVFASWTFCSASCFRIYMNRWVSHATTLERAMQTHIHTCSRHAIMHTHTYIAFSNASYMTCVIIRLPNVFTAFMHIIHAHIAPTLSRTVMFAHAYKEAHFLYT